MLWSDGPRYCWGDVQLSRTHWLCHFALAFSAVSVAAGIARAEPQLFVHLDYQVAPELSGCPSDEAFREMVAAQLGYAPFRADSEYRVIARARGDGGAIQGSVEWQDASGVRRGRRELRAEHVDCAAFARGMAFAIAVQIQLLAEEEEQGHSSTPAESATTSTPAPSAAPAVVAPPPPRVEAQAAAERDALVAARDESSRVRFLVGAGPALGFWLTPTPAVEARVFVGLRRGAWLAELGLEASLPGSYSTANGQGFEQRVELGSLAGCALLPPLSGCLVSKLGRLHVTGFGVDAPRSPAGVLFQVGPRLALGQEWGGWLGALRIDALVTLVPWRVTLNRLEVWQTPVLTLGLGLDVAALFP